MVSSMNVDFVEGISIRQVELGLTTLTESASYMKRHFGNDPTLLLSSVQLLSR